MKQLYTNNAKAAIVSSIDDTDTQISIASGKGALFAEPFVGDEYQIATIINPANLNAPIEIVKITERVDDVLTVERGQEGTTPQSWTAGSAEIQGRATAGMFERLVQTDDESDETGFGVGGGSARAANSVAIGAFARTYGEKSVSLGAESRALAPRSFAIGEESEATMTRSFEFAVFPALQNGFDLTEDVQYLQGLSSLFASPYMELAEGSEWAATTVYKSGDVVVPTTPNGFAYRLDVELDRDFDEFSSVLNFELESGSTEPTWPEIVGDLVPANDAEEGYWRCISLDENTLYIPDGVAFYPDEVGFICTDYVSVSAAPYVSIGTAADPTALVNNQQMTGITAANTRHRFTGLTKGITGSAKFTVETAATGTGSTLQGRFYMRGVFFQLKGNF